MTELQNENRLLTLAKEFAMAMGQHKLAEILQVQWNPRLRSTAGRAFLRKSRIELNPLLIRCGDEEILRTLKHELAHLIVYQTAGLRVQPHGLEWQTACEKLDIPGEKATHRLPILRQSMRKKFRYHCPSCDVFFERVRRIQREAACKACCQKFANGKFSEKYLLIESQLP